MSIKIFGKKINNIRLGSDNQNTVLIKSMKDKSDTIFSNNTLKLEFIASHTILNKNYLYFRNLANLSVDTSDNSLTVNTSDGVSSIITAKHANYTQRYWYSSPSWVNVPTSITSNTQLQVNSSEHFKYTYTIQFDENLTLSEYDYPNIYREDDWGGIDNYYTYDEENHIIYIYATAGATITWKKSSDNTYILNVDDSFFDIYTSEGMRVTRNFHFTKPSNTTSAEYYWDQLPSTTSITLSKDMSQKITAKKYELFTVTLKGTYCSVNKSSLTVQNGTQVTQNDTTLTFTQPQGTTYTVTYTKYSDTWDYTYGNTISIRGVQGSTTSSPPFTINANTTITGSYTRTTNNTTVTILNKTYTVAAHSIVKLSMVSSTQVKWTIGTTNCGTETVDFIPTDTYGPDNNTIYPASCYAYIPVNADSDYNSTTKTVHPAGTYITGWGTSSTTKEISSPNLTLVLHKRKIGRYFTFADSYSCGVGKIDSSSLLVMNAGTTAIDNTSNYQGSKMKDLTVSSGSAMPVVRFETTTERGVLMRVQDRSGASHTFLIYAFYLGLKFVVNGISKSITGITSGLPNIPLTYVKQPLGSYSLEYSAYDDTLGAESLSSVVITPYTYVPSGKTLSSVAQDVSKGPYAKDETTVRSLTAQLSGVDLSYPAYIEAHSSTAALNPRSVATFVGWERSSGNEITVKFKSSSTGTRLNFDATFKADLQVNRYVIIDRVFFIE